MEVDQKGIMVVVSVFSQHQMAFKSLLILVAVLGVVLADSDPYGPWGCQTEVKPTKRTEPGSTWEAGDYEYQVYDLVISNNSPGNCTVISCTPSYYFIKAVIIAQWNWAATCSNCNPDGTPAGDEETVGGPVTLYHHLKPSAKLSTTGFIVEYNKTDKNNYAINYQSPQYCACNTGPRYPNCETQYL